MYILIVWPNRFKRLPRPFVHCAVCYGFEPHIRCLLSDPQNGVWVFFVSDSYKFIKSSVTQDIVPRRALL